MKAKLTEKEIAALDKKIAALEPKVHEAKRTYNDLIEELAKLIEARYPERQEDAIKDRLYQAYIHSSKDTVVIKVGSVEHPSLPEHFITFILLETSTGIHTKWLKPGDKPTTTYNLTDGDTAVAAYEFCNLHGLWKADV